MATRNISLPKELEEYINAKVASGEYAHASEVVRDAVRLMRQREAEKLEWLREAIAEGIASPVLRFATPEDFLAEVKRRGRALLKADRKRR